VSDVFISYAREDRQTASTLAALLSRAGYDIFWDRDLLSGSDFEQVIEVELAQAKAVVVLWSATSVRSGWVRDEAADAMARGVLVPVAVAGVDPPLGFRSLHVIPFSTDPTELLRAIVRLAAQPARAAAKPIRPLGIGLIEAACLLLLLAVLATFFLKTYLP
jgi:TIR domain-containing protein